MCTGQGRRDDSLMGRWQGTSLEFAFTKCYRYKDMLYIYLGVQLVGCMQGSMEIGQGQCKPPTYTTL